MKVCLECGELVDNELTICPKCGRQVKFEDICNPPIQETNKEE